MSTVLAQNHCWNHPSREAVCRCLGCSRSFCRECVTEHDARLLCAACVAASAAQGKDRVRGRGLLAPGAAVVGLLLAMMTFFSTGRMIFEIKSRLQEQQWRQR